jgi:hypothetical protein
MTILINEWILSNDWDFSAFQDESGYYDYEAWAEYWAYINGLNESTGQNNNTTPPPDTRYYIRTDGGSGKYYTGDTIYVPQRQGKVVTLTLVRESSPPDTTRLRWKQNDTTKCTSVINCTFDVSQIGSRAIRVDSGNILIRMQNVLKVYKKPTVYFKRWGYNGEYGFDDYDSTFIHFKDTLRFKAGYEIKHINEDNSYKVPWMSLLENQSANILDSMINLSADAKHDKNGYVVFRPSSPKIQVDGNDTLRRDYISLMSNSIVPISAIQLDSAVGYIYAITNTHDTIGKLHISCKKPVIKKVVYVYVNTGSGYDTTLLSKTALLNGLNQHSHNQFMRQWVIDNRFSDTLNLTSEYAAFPNIFKGANMPNIFPPLYKAHKGIDIDSMFNALPSPNDTGKVEFFFISKLLLQDSVFDATGTLLGTSTTTGSTNRGRVGSVGSLFPNGIGGGVPTATVTSAEHEHAHALDLVHPFDPPYNIARFGTTNILDYFNPPNDNRNWFGFFQWIDVY